MAASMIEFQENVFTVVRLIPHGKVTSYSHVAKLCGFPKLTAQVDQVLKLLPDGTDIPWQRVVSSKGELSSRGAGSWCASQQAAALGAEGIEVRMGPAGDYRVEMNGVGWFPTFVNI